MNVFTPLIFEAIQYHVDNDIRERGEIQLTNAQEYMRKELLKPGQYEVDSVPGRLAAPARVVVPLDASQLALRAVQPAVALAERWGARIEVLTVLDDGDKEESARQLDLVVERVSDGGPPVGALVESGTDPGAVIAEVTREPDTLVCMATHGRRGVTAALLGSTAEAVVRASRRPVLLVGPRAQAPRLSDGQHLLVPLDGSERSESVLSSAPRFADSLGLDVWLLHVTEAPASAGLSSEVPRSELISDARLQRIGESLQDGGVPSSWDTASGDPARSIVDYAQAERCALVAMTTHGRTGLSRVTAGSVTMQVVHDSAVPVLVVRPEGR
jgi:nucleotide-binding universal stress UspA family protein